MSAARRNPKGMRRSGGPGTNRSAKGGARSSPHYGGEGVLWAATFYGKPRAGQPLTVNFARMLPVEAEAERETPVSGCDALPRGPADCLAGKRVDRTLVML